MHVNLIFYVRTHHKDSNKPSVNNVHSRWHLAPSEAGLSDYRESVKFTFRRHGAKGSYLTLVRVADRIL